MFKTTLTQPHRYGNLVKKGDEICRTINEWFNWLSSIVTSVSFENHLKMPFFVPSSLRQRLLETCKATADFALFSGFGWHRRGDPLKSKKFFCPKLLFLGGENFLSLDSIQNFEFFQVFYLKNVFLSNKTQLNLATERSQLYHFGSL